MKLTDELVAEIKERYYKNENAISIAMYTGLSETTVSKVIRNKTYSGEWEKHKTKKVEIKRNADGTVKCDKYVIRHCIYGAISGETCCHYYLYYGIGHRRGCPASHCNKFEYGSPRDKRKKKEVDNGRETVSWDDYYRTDSEEY